MNGPTCGILWGVGEAAMPAMPSGGGADAAGNRQSRLGSVSHPLILSGRSHHLSGVPEPGRETMTMMSGDHRDDDDQDDDDGGDGGGDGGSNPLPLPSCLPLSPRSPHCSCLIAPPLFIPAKVFMRISCYVDTRRPDACRLSPASADSVSNGCD